MTDWVLHHKVGPFDMTVGYIFPLLPVPFLSHTESERAVVARLLSAMKTTGLFVRAALALCCFLGESFLSNCIGCFSWTSGQVISESIGVLEIIAEAAVLVQGRSLLARGTAGYKGKARLFAMASVSM